MATVFPAAANVGIGTREKGPVRPVMYFQLLQEKMDDRTTPLHLCIHSPRAYLGLGGYHAGVKRDDDRFIRGGRGLRAWLPELLASDAVVRRRAADALIAMWWGSPLGDLSDDRHRPRDLDAHRRAWGVAIDQALIDDAFSGQEFVGSCLKRIKQEAGNRCDHPSELWRWEARGGAPLEMPVQPNKLVARIHRWLGWRRKGAWTTSDYGTYTVKKVLEHAGSILIRMPDVVRAALRDPDCRYTIANALQNLGTAAVAFAPDLLALDPASPRRRRILFPGALASVARSDRTTVLTLLDLLEIA